MADVGLTSEQVIAVCAELADPALSTEEWDLLIELTQAEINPGANAFATVARANIAARYLCAHKAVKFIASRRTGSSIGGAAGPLSSVTVGAISKTFRTPGTVDAGSSVDAEFQTTAPGREYLRLVRLWCGRVFAI